MSFRKELEKHKPKFEYLYIPFLKVSIITIVSYLLFLSGILYFFDYRITEPLLSVLLEFLICGFVIYFFLKEKTKLFYGATASPSNKDNSPSGLRSIMFLTMCWTIIFGHFCVYSFFDGESYFLTLFWSVMSYISGSMVLMLLLIKAGMKEV